MAAVGNKNVKKMFIRYFFDINIKTTETSQLNTILEMPKTSKFESIYIGVTLFIKNVLIILK